MDLKCPSSSLFVPYVAVAKDHEWPVGVPDTGLLSALNITIYIIEVMNENPMTAHK
jgi:hypothetical protein